MPDQTRDQTNDQNELKDGPEDGLEDETYEVGYAKPPTNSQFQPGRSGNPKGRPKGAKSFRGHIKSALDSKVVISDQQGRRQITAMEAMAKRLVEKGLNGDLKTMLALLSMDAVQSDEELSPLSETLSASEKQILAEVLNRQTSS